MGFASDEVRRSCCICGGGSAFIAAHSRRHAQAARKTFRCACSAGYGGATCNAKMAREACLRSRQRPLLQLHPSAAVVPYIADHTVTEHTDEAFVDGKQLKSWARRAQARCEAESCMVMPTGCGKRAECAGCGALCFGGTPHSPAYNRFLNNTGLSQQTSSLPAWSPAEVQTAVVHDQQGWPLTQLCLQNKGGGYLGRWRPREAPSQSATACAAACASTPACRGWNLGSAASGNTVCMTFRTPKERANVNGTVAQTCHSAKKPPESHTSMLTRSADIVLTWNRIQPHPPPAAVDWTQLRESVKRARPVGAKILVLLWTGQRAPAWVYDHGVETLATGSLHDPHSSCPNYQNAAYQRLLKALNVALAAEVRSLNSVGHVIMGIQSCLGSTGDDTAIHPDDWSNVNRTLLNAIGGPGSGSSSSWWTTFSRQHATWMQSTVLAAEIRRGELVVALNAQGTSFPLDWVQAHLPGSFFKRGHAGHDYQLNGERHRAAAAAPFLYSLQQGRPVRSRAELSYENCWTAGPYANFTACPLAWNYYAMAQFLCSVHLDFWNVQWGSSAAGGVMEARLNSRLGLSCAHS